MKSIVCFLSVFWISSCWLAQTTGNAVVLMTDGSYEFNETSVDSTSTFEFQLANTIGTTQTIYFGGLDSPFELSIDEPVTLGAQESFNLSVSFTPSSPGLVTDTLEVVGSIFGNAQLVLSGQGVLVELSWIEQPLLFDTLAVGENQILPFLIQNTGDGEAVISNVSFDDSAFSLNSSISDLSIEEGGTGELHVVFSPTAPGHVQGIMSITTNAPQSPEIAIPLSGIATSQISGEVCGHWTQANSPYFLVGDVSVPAGCSLQIGPGVEIFGDTMNIEVFGSLIAEGTADQKIHCEIGSLISQTASDSLSLSFVDLFELDVITHDDNLYSSLSNVLNDNQFNSISDALAAYPLQFSFYSQFGVNDFESEFELSPGGFHQFVDSLVNPSPYSPPYYTGTYKTEFSGSSDTLGWDIKFSEYGSSSYSDVEWDMLNLYGEGEYYDNDEVTFQVCPYDYCNQDYLQIRRECCNSDSWYSINVLSPEFALNGFEESVNWQVRASSLYDDNSGYDQIVIISYRIDGGDWIEGSTYNAPFIEAINYGDDYYYYNLTLNHDIPTGSSSIQYRIEFRDKYYGGIRIEEATLNANTWLSSDIQEAIRIQHWSLNGTDDVVSADGNLFNVSLSGQEVVTFSKQDYASTSDPSLWDHVSENVALYRCDNGGLYNALTQNCWSGSVDGVLWGPTDSQDLDDFYSSMQDALYYYLGASQFGSVFPGNALSMYVIESEEFYVVDFTGWSCCYQGGFSYTRTKVGPFIGPGTIPSNLYQRTPEDETNLLAISTGGISMINSTLHGNYNAVSLGEIQLSLIDTQIFSATNANADSPGISINGNATIQSSNVQIIGHNREGLLLTGGVFNINTENTSIGHNSGNGISIQGDYAWVSAGDSIHYNGQSGVALGGFGDASFTNLAILHNEGAGLTTESISSVNCLGCEVSFNAGPGINIQTQSITADIKYSILEHNSGNGLVISANPTLNNVCNILNSALSNNGGHGFKTNIPASCNYSNFISNNGAGLAVAANTTLTNSIVWNNTSAISAENSNVSCSYSDVQGGTNSQGTDSWSGIFLGDGCIDTDPYLEADYTLDENSPCVDAAMPWEHDAHMPFGLGTAIADMGMFGGPNNQFWGGQAPPSGAVIITNIFDIPDDQGGQIGLHFSASPFDINPLGSITSYSIWRDLALGSDSPAEVVSGNWEQIGEVPAQGFSQYGYTAETLVDAYPGEEACLTSFIVIAHTTDDNIYWVSDVAAACSEDNLAPAEPVMAGLILAENGDDAIALLSWSLPEEEDYAYTSIAGSNGFLGTVSNGDTLITDTSIQSGQVVLYEAVHIDIHGNVSEPAFVELEAQVGSDVIELNAGWNLISTDRAVDQNVGEVFAGLSEGNLQYVTGFEGGVQFYDPSGLSFLNTLSTLTPGHGYWVKVEADDVLEVSGTRLDEAYMPALLEGWNLVGYAAEDPAAPGDVFADLEAEGDLLYVTGFDQGVQVYDPNGLSFLNTLTEMRNGFGYWVKSAVATEGDVLAPLSDDVLPAAKPSPRYDVVNGTSTLGDHAGEFVDVLDGWGTVVARLPILEGGHLMTTALFGDDPATGIVEGLAEGDVLHFAFRGSMANETLVFGGNMAHKTLALTFEELEAGLSVFPNPAVDMTTVRVHAVEAGLATLEVTDVQGRVVLRQDLSLAAGVQAVTLDVDALEGGAYNVELRQGTTPLGTSRLVVLD